MSDLTVDEKTAPHDKNNTGLTLAALGIVFGDIGTSPLYTLKTVLDLAGGNPAPETALGLLSLILWTLLITVSLKYVTFVMQADNDGEGGILALMSLLRVHKHHRPVIIALGLFGAALIYGDGAITPAISVLSAVEGLKIATPTVAPYVLLISVIILLALFAVQSLGTARIGRGFGPVMTLWFLAIGILGLWGIVQHPAVLAAINPWYGLHFLINNGAKGFLVLGGVFLAVTGAEALYADMGHIGARPIRLAWYGLVLPALLLNYTGQTALLLGGNPVGENIFYQLCPAPLLLPLIGLATVATIIASQSIITGAYSMTRQAIQLGWCPRLRITQTSSEGYGQIYISAVNWVLMIVTVGLTIMFGSSDRLAAAYGIAVSLTMLLTTMLLFVMTREIWKWSLPISLMVTGAFFCIDASFFSANLLKFLDGGWVPLLLAIGTYIVMVTWRRGSDALAKGMRSLTVPVHDFIARLDASAIARVPGTAVFLSKTTEETPPIIVWQVTYNKALHRHIVALSVVIAQTPWINEDERLTTERLAPDFWRLIASYGFMEKPDIPSLLQQAKKRGCDLDLSDVTYYVGHETIMHCPDGTGLPLWQEMIYAFLQRNSAQIHEYLNLPHESVIEIGRQIEI
jgi:KUP system potassium uptake protein